MDMAQVLDVTREAIIVLLKLAAPLMIIALLVGLVISLFQALTQIQEMTLAFVPKILVIFVSLIFFLPFMVTTLVTFTQGLATRIIGIG
ncbi:MAG: flagellar biosynthesis protein FliQ [Alphaproteobacteria bacterium]|nr:flagellar biosynthesis protein FliQ [Alphaproteobacteria bacterium]